MNNMKKSLRYQLIESKKFILQFWITVMLVDIFFYILNSLATGNLIVFNVGKDFVDFNIGFSLGNSELAVGNSASPISVVGINLMIIFIVFIVYNYERNYENFPLSLSLGMTRKDYFVSFLIDNVVIAFIFASIQGVLLKIDPKIMKLIGKEPLYEFINFNLQTDNILYIIFSLFILFLAFTSFFNLLASLNYKFGYKIWIVIGGFNMLFTVLNINVLVNIAKKLSQYFGRIVVTRFGIFETVVILISIAIMYTLNYFITINSNVKRRAI